MMRIDEHLAQDKAVMLELRQRINQALGKAPTRASASQKVIEIAAVLEVFARGWLGYEAVQLLADYDAVARKITLAHHHQRIDAETKDAWLDDGAHVLRSLAMLPLQYQYSGTTREDFAANNDNAKQARKRFGELPQAVLAQGLRVWIL